jgi:hypothetical protein
LFEVDRSPATMLRRGGSFRGCKGLIIRSGGFFGARRATVKFAKHAATQGIFAVRSFTFGNRQRPSLGSIWHVCGTTGRRAGPASRSAYVGTRVLERQSFAWRVSWPGRGVPACWSRSAAPAGDRQQRPCARPAARPCLGDWTALYFVASDEWDLRVLGGLLMSAPSDVRRGLLHPHGRRLPAGLREVPAQDRCAHPGLVRILPLDDSGWGPSTASVFGGGRTGRP